MSGGEIVENGGNWFRKLTEQEAVDLCKDVPFFFFRYHTGSIELSLVPIEWRRQRSKTDTVEDMKRWYRNDRCYYIRLDEEKPEYEG